MPYKEGVLLTNKKKVIEDIVKNEKLKKFLKPFAERSSNGIAYIRLLCSYTREDWAFYMACLDYEYIDNRDEEDKEERTAIGSRRDSNQRPWSMLTEEQFNEIKEEYPLSKKLKYEPYTYLRWRMDSDQDRKILEEVFTSS